MIIVLKPNTQKEQKDKLVDWLKDMGLGVHVSEGQFRTVLGLIGDTADVDMDLISSLAIVDSVKRVSERFKCCNRQFHPDEFDIRGFVPPSPYGFRSKVWAVRFDQEPVLREPLHEVDRSFQTFPGRRRRIHVSGTHGVCPVEAPQPE